MATSKTLEALELEFMRSDDSSWHPCEVSLSPHKAGLIVKFSGEDFNDVVLNKEEALVQLRGRSSPLQAEDCSHIKQGAHVLATYVPKNLHFEAQVEKVIRVRHSKRAYCRCTFSIKWLHGDHRGETCIVPSTSIMKLGTKRSSDHPTVAAFLKSAKNMRFSAVSPFLAVLEEMDSEMDLTKLVEQQLEKMGDLADAPDVEISEDIVKVELEKEVNGTPTTASKVSISHVQAKSFKLTELKDQSTSMTVEENHSESRSLLSPLAGRAALASFVSRQPQKFDLLKGRKGERSFFCASNATDQKDVSEKLFNGIDSFTSPKEDMFLKKKLPSEKADASSDSTSRLKRDCTMRTDLVRNSRLVKAISETPKEMTPCVLSMHSTRSACPARKRKLNQKATSTNCNVQTKMNSDDTIMRALTGGKRLTRSAVLKEKDKTSKEANEGLTKELVQTIKSDTPRVQTTNFKSNVAKKKSSMPEKVAEMDLQIEESNKKQSRNDADTGQHPQGKVSSGDSQGKRSKHSSTKKQDLRFSPRLSFLPKTRSQNKF